jgi:hypothetical protein
MSLASCLTARSHPGIFDNINQLLKEGVRGLDKEANGGDSGADAGVLDKRFAKGVTLAGVIVCVFGADTRKPEGSS